MGTNFRERDARENNKAKKRALQNRRREERDAVKLAQKRRLWAAALGQSGNTVNLNTTDAFGRRQAQLSEIAAQIEKARRPTNS